MLLNRLVSPKRIIFILLAVFAAVQITLGLQGKLDEDSFFTKVSSKVNGVYQSFKISTMEPVESFENPVFNATSSDFSDTWGAPRSGGRKHEGTDIFAKRGTPVISPTNAVILSISETPIGGKNIFTLNPGGERYYYAHLDSISNKIGIGDYIESGTTIGTVGTSGNAEGTPPHLHFGIYTNGGAINPFGRIK